MESVANRNFSCKKKKKIEDIQRLHATAIIFNELFWQACITVVARRWLLMILLSLSCFRVFRTSDFSRFYLTRITGDPAGTVTCGSERDVHRRKKCKRSSELALTTYHLLLTKATKRNANSAVRICLLRALSLVTIKRR